MLGNPHTRTPKRKPLGSTLTSSGQNINTPQQAQPIQRTQQQFRDTMNATGDFVDAFRQFTQIYNNHKNLKMNKKEALELLRLGYEQEIVNSKLSGMSAGISISEEDSSNASMVYEDLRKTLDRAETRVKEKYKAENFGLIISEIFQGLLTLGTASMTQKKFGSWLSKLGYHF